MFVPSSLASSEISIASLLFVPSSSKSAVNAAAPGFSDIIDYVTLASTGNALDFGNLTEGRKQSEGTASSTTRGLQGGAELPSASYTAGINLVTIQSTGNATDFGDTTDSAGSKAGNSNSTRATFSGGDQPSVVNIIDYITIASTGDAADFGDLTVARAYHAGLSNGGGYLTSSGNEPQRPSVTYMPGSGRALSAGGQEPGQERNKIY